jgi:phage tail-like protein
MPARREDILLRVSAFEVLVGAREIGFAQVGPLASETVTAEPGARPVNRYPAIVLRRALTTSSELYEWRRAIVAGKDDRRDVTIRQLSAPGGKAVNAWRLVRAWPSRWSGPDLDAAANDVAMEELELTYDDLVWLTNDQLPGG